MRQIQEMHWPRRNRIAQGHSRGLSVEKPRGPVEPDPRGRKKCRAIARTSARPPGRFWINTLAPAERCPSPQAWGRLYDSAAPVLLALAQFHLHCSSCSQEVLLNAFTIASDDSSFLLRSGPEQRRRLMALAWAECQRIQPSAISLGRALFILMQPLAFKSRVGPARTTSCRHHRGFPNAV